MDPSRVRGAARASARRWLPGMLCLLLAPALATAQVTPEPTPPDTTGRDTVLVPIPPTDVSPDTLPPDSAMRTAGDSTSAPPFPAYPHGLPTGWAYGRWEFGPEELRTHSGLTLLAFLERVPGLTIVRAGDHGYPVGVSAFGLGGGRVRIFLDGFEVDPLGFASPDLQQLGTIDLESIRIERESNGIRIDLTPVRLVGGRPHSVVEAGTGAYDSKFVRGVLVRGLGGRSILSAAYDAVTTDGYAFDAPFALVSARAAWSYALSERTVLQAEFQSQGFERVGRGFAENADRRILLVRARSEVAPGLTLDGAVGRTTRDPADQDLVDRDLSSIQAMARASLERGATWTEATVRVRDSQLEVSSAPRLDLSARASFTPFAAIGADGEIRYAPLDPLGGLSGRVTARLGSPRASVFATASLGEAPLGLVRDTTIEGIGDEDDRVEPRFSAEDGRVDAIRVGAEWAGPAISLGAAVVRVPESRVIPFGSELDRGLPAVDASAATGAEAHASATVPGTRGLARLEGWASYWTDTGDRPYLPEIDARGAAILGGLFYDGQLEPRLRFEVAHRGAMLARSVGSGPAGSRTSAYTLANLLLQIRIIDVQAFGLWENVFNYRTAADVPGLPLPGVRLVYGIRWVFRN